ncbi:MAG: 2-dehydro-3-deoxy-D-gluconate 5-dehydrogenase KduD [Lachnospira sp.]|nr:2-dehydro-3-deoxy-D-gluconate 5-dehydrogenase KduD [Lachnospira sp.]
MILDLFSLKGKTALVTGANTGLGQGICIALAEAGAEVIGVARRSCEETAELIKESNGSFTEIIVDLSDKNAVTKITEQTDTLGKTVDILVNNAGIIKRADAIDVTEDDWDQVINLNERLVFFLSQAVAKKYMIPKNEGKIINIASMLSYQGGIRVPAYAASKSAVMGITKALANEWASLGININAIAPGYMATNNTAQLRQDADRNEAVLDRIPAARWGTNMDLAGTAVYLASHASDYVNGFTIAVDGGWLSR